MISVFDGMRMGFTRIPLYSIVFHCRATGGELTAHPLETNAVGFFAADALPEATVGVERWGDMAFAAIRGEHLDVSFDTPRSNPWRPGDLA